MKIRNIDRTEPGIQNVREPDSLNNYDDNQLVFKRTLNDLSRDQANEHLSALLTELEKQGKRLQKRRDITEFQRYRGLIREFINDVVSRGYAYSKENAFSAKGKHRFLATVKTVDEKLDALAKDILSQQSDCISILHQIDDIRGLLLDMLL